MTEPPDNAAVQAQLERILASEHFAGAGRHTRVLRYLVERTLAGEGEQLKEYVLGTEVFDRDDAYDPRIDSIVRVEVRRLRARLEDYYRGTGAGDPIVISIPRGAYVPVFAARRSADTSSDAGGFVATASSTGQPIPSRPSTLTAAVAIVLLLTAGWLAVTWTRSPDAQASSGPAIAVLPFELYSSAPSNALAAAELTDTVTTALAKLGTVSVASRTSASQYGGEVRPVPAIAAALKVDFVMEASATFRGDQIRVSARLVDGRRDRKVWVGEYHFSAAEMANASHRIATEAAAAALTYAAR